MRISELLKLKSDGTWQFLYFKPLLIIKSLKLRNEFSPNIMYFRIMNMRYTFVNSKNVFVLKYRWKKLLFVKRP